MGVFAVNERAVVGGGKDGAHLLLGGVHPGADVDVSGVLPYAAVAGEAATCRPFVVDEAARVAVPDPGSHGGVVGPRTGLVAEAPADDGGVVLVALQHPDGAVEHGRGVLRHAADLAAGLVGLEVGFVHDVDAYGVGQFVQIGVVRVVATAEGVDVEGLHQPQVFTDLGAGNGLAVVGGMVVAIYAVENDRIAVNEHAIRTPGDVAEADVETADVHGFPRRVAHGHHQSVKVRGFGRPGQRGGHLQVEAVEVVDAVGVAVGLRLVVVGDGVEGNVPARGRAAVRGEEGSGEGPVFDPGGVAEVNAGFEAQAAAVVVVQGGFGEQVAEVLVG